MIYVYLQHVSFVTPWMEKINCIVPNSCSVFSGGKVPRINLQLKNKILDETPG